MRAIHVRSVRVAPVRGALSHGDHAPIKALHYFDDDDDDDAVHGAFRRIINGQSSS